MATPQSVRTLQSNSSTISPSLQTAIESRLADFFTVEDQSTIRIFSDLDVQQISNLLEKTHTQYSRIPRIYIVLRYINKLDVIETFINKGCTDFYFPFSLTSLPSELSPHTRHSFIEAQSSVLTKITHLEKGESGNHIHFANVDELPYETLGICGSGAYGQVQKVWSKLSHREYARKQIRRTRNAKENAMFERELAILKKMKHRHVVEVVASYTDPHSFCLIMTPLADCNLAEFYDSVLISQNKLSLLRSFFGCLATALAYLHDSQVRHKDIKPQNILVYKDKVLLTDFGISRDFSDLSRSTTTGPAVKTPRYCAPEVGAGDPRNTSSDVWSLGCVFLEMLSILNGETIQSMKVFYETHGSELASFYRNPDATEQWMERLAAKGDTRENFPLPIIRHMLHLELRSRPTARTVTEKLQLADSGLSFCGVCCMHDDSDSIFETEQSVDIVDSCNVLSGIPDLVTESRIDTPSPVRLESLNDFQLPLMPLRRRASAVSDISGSTQHTQIDFRSLLPESFVPKNHVRFAHDGPLFFTIKYRDPHGVSDLLERGHSPTSFQNYAPNTGPPARVRLNGKWIQEGRLSAPLETPLHLAVSSGQHDVAKLLLQHGADVLAVDSKSSTPLFYAVSNEDMEMAMLLLQAGAEKEFKQRICRRGVRYPPVLQEAVKSKNLEMTRLLLNHGATSKLYTKSKRREKGGRRYYRTDGSVLHDCMNGSTPEIARLLIEYGSDVSAVDANGNTALHIAAFADSRENRAFVEVLIEHGADPNVKNHSSDTSLHIAMQKHDLDMCKILLRAGAKCKIPGSLLAPSATALAMAVRNSDVKWTKLFMEHACDLDIRGEDGRMALFEALGQGLFDNAQLLLSSGVSFTAVTKDRQTLLHLAVKHGHKHSQPRANFIRSLIRQGVDVNAQDKNGETALHAAVSKADEETVQLLCEAGIDVRLKNAAGDMAGENLKSYERLSKRGIYKAIRDAKKKQSNSP